MVNIDSSTSKTESCLQVPIKYRAAKKSAQDITKLRCLNNMQSGTEMVIFLMYVEIVELIQVSGVSLLNTGVCLLNVFQKNNIICKNYSILAIF